ncbi:MAG: PQQ-binding-like beta-propeller repeat protein [Verrucomicrobia bacterium]|nr:PQQ-binding-like beta-propeller repeat protein [Verrucomicrobiota bacterium]
MKPSFFALLFAATIASAENWPEWRGAGAQGISAAKALPETWSETSSIRWKKDLPGRGHSTPIVVGDQIWLTTAIEKAATADQAKAKLASNTGDQPLTVLDSVSLRVVCVDKNTGVILTDLEVLNVKEPQWAHTLNSYASPSPLIFSGRLYAHFGSFGTICMDTTTQAILWKNEELHIMHENGPGSTAILHGKHLIAHFDGSDQQFIAAFDIDTGKVAWKKDRSGTMDPRPQQRKAYGTPLIVTMNGQPVVVSSAADWVYGYHPETGKELWKIAYEGLGFSMSTCPVADAERVYISTSFGKSQVIALKYAGIKTPEIAWRNAKNAPKMCSPILTNDLLFYIDDGGIVSCIDPKTGEAHYRERLGGKFSASPIVADGKIYFASREGVVTVIATDKTFKILSQNTLDGALMASPIAVDSTLYLRTDKALYRIEK